MAIKVNAKKLTGAQTNCQSFARNLIYVYCAFTKCADPEF
jgi:hypothetical protein